MTARKPGLVRITVVRRRGRPIAAGLFLALATQACTVWTPARRAPADVLTAYPNSPLRVTRSSGERIVLRSAHVRGDSLSGIVQGPRGRRPVTTVALWDIRQVEVAQVHAGRTVGFIALVGVAAGLLAAAAADDPPARRPSWCSEENCSITSCPLVYSWDGTRWRLDSGTFGGAIVQALERTDLDNLDFAAAPDGALRLKVANELQETDYIDALSVLAVDHAIGVTVAPDPQGEIHTLGPLTEPIEAVDFRGRDALARIRTVDGWHWESSPARRDTAVVADLRDGLELAFVRPQHARHAHLVLDGNSSPWAARLLTEFVRAHGSATQAWYDSLDARPEHAAALGARLASEGFLAASVWADDRWVPQGLFWEAGPEVIKRQVLDLDLSMIRDDTVRVRLESVPLFWVIDHVALDFTTDQPVTIQELSLARAENHEGKSVREPLASVDQRYLVMETGDWAELEFRVSEIPWGVARSYLLRSTGWYRVRVPEVGAPDEITLHRIAHEPLGISRLAVARMNEGLAAMERVAR